MSGFSPDLEGAAAGYYFFLQKKWSGTQGPGVRKFPNPRADPPPRRLGTAGPPRGPPRPPDPAGDPPRGWGVPGGSPGGGRTPPGGQKTPQKRGFFTPPGGVQKRGKCPRKKGN